MRTVERPREDFQKNSLFESEEKPSVEENLGLVRLCAARFRGKGIEYEELYSAGCVGLLKAVRAFDPSKGVRFSTYAVPVILGEIRRLFRDGGTVKVSRLIKERSMLLSRLQESFEHENGRPPTLDELATASGLDRQEVSEAISAGQPVLSLSLQDGDEKSGQLELPVDPPDLKITDKIALRQLIHRLDKKDRLLIYLRFYLCLTQQKTASRLGMTQVQVSRREKKLLEQLKAELLS